MVANTLPFRTIVWATLTLTILLFLLHEKVSAQERRTAPRPKGTLSAPLSPRAVATRAIAEINRIRNVMAISQVKAGIPYMRNTFREPWIQQTFTSVNKADTIQGGSFQVYQLRDSFRLRTAYDGKHVIKAYEEESDSLLITNLQQYPYDAHATLGPLHLYIRNVMEQALTRNATLNTTEENDSLKLEVLFPDYYIEIDAVRIRMARDTVGFLSRYVIYLDRNTFLPIKIMRDMPHQTTVETILFQRINYTDTLAIDALKSPEGSTITNLGTSAGLPATLPRASINSLVGTSIYAWKLAKVDRDTLSLETLKGHKSVIVFNSVGWRPCMQVLPFLTRLSTTMATSVVSIEPFITNAEALKKHCETHTIGYPLVMIDRTLKKTYSGIQVPTFLVTDARGIVRDVIVGYTGTDTEAQVQQALQRIRE
jgi:hypothetical protein